MQLFTDKINPRTHGGFFGDYSIENTEDWNNFKLIDFKPKPAGDYDIDIKIYYCGVCGSDVRTRPLP